MTAAASLNRDPAIKTERFADGAVQLTVRCRPDWRQFGLQAGYTAFVAILLAWTIPLVGSITWSICFPGTQMNWLLVEWCIFCLVVGMGLLRILNKQLIGMMVRITPQRLVVLQRSLRGEKRLDWRREDILAVRRSRDELHIRHRREAPRALLKNCSQWELDDAAAAINAAMAQVPQLPVDDAVPHGLLTYEVAGHSYEIEIEQSPDRLTIVVPQAEIHAMGIEWFVPMIIAAFIGGSLLPGNLPILVIPGTVVLALVGSVVLASVRRGQPLRIVVTRNHVHVEHPGLIIRSRTWRRDVITNVYVDAAKDRQENVTGYFVRFDKRGSRSIAFCHGRDMSEMKRVVSALRQALGLPQLSILDFPDDYIA